MKKITYYFFLLASLYLSFQLFRVAYIEFTKDNILTTILFAVLALATTQIPSILKPHKPNS